jgi:hypothetical protein
VFFILVSRRYHSVQRNTCSLHFQLSFPSCRQEVKNRNSLKLLVRSFVISRFVHCFQHWVSETKCTNGQECSGTLWFVSCDHMVLMCKRAGAGGGQTAFGIKLDLQRAWGGGRSIFLGLSYWLFTISKELLILLSRCYQINHLRGTEWGDDTLCCMPSSPVLYYHDVNRTKFID